MFFKGYWLAFSLLFVTVFALFFFFSSPSEKEALTYFQVLKETRSARSEKALTKRPMGQIKEFVQKDLWIPHGEQRLHTRIQSAHSHLDLSENRGKLEAKEHLTNIQCLLQEEIDPFHHTQELRFFSSQEGFYTYPEHRFTSKQVDIAFFVAPGTLLPSVPLSLSPYLTGTANEVLFRATSQAPLLTAHHLRARILTEENLP